MARILTVSPTPSHPQDAGNRTRIFSLFSGLKAAGHKVFFALVGMETGDEAGMKSEWDDFFSIAYQRPEDSWLKQKYDKWAKRFGSMNVLPYRIDDWYTPKISQKLLEIKKKVNPDVVLVEYVFMSKSFECFGPDTLKILDTHDIFGGRHRLYIEKGMIPQWFYTTVAQEKKALDRADLILAIQDNEADYLRGFTHKKVINVGHMVKVSQDIEGGESETGRLLFVGSANPINVEALNWFLKEVLPVLRDRIPGIELEAVGDCTENVSAQEGFIRAGRVSDLAPYYSKAKVVINPVRFGTGLKIKSIEALAHGRPLVTTRAGAAGLEEWAGRPFLVADTPEEFAGAITKVYSSPDLRIKLVTKARQLVQNYNQTALKPLEESIEAFMTGNEKKS